MSFISSMISKIILSVQWMVERAQSIPYALPALLARVAIAPVFWFSGRTKVDGFELSSSAVALFRYEYGLPFPEIMAVLAALAEHILPICLILGFATRFAASGLFVMTIVIQFVYPLAWWNHHALWFAILGFLIVRGGGAISCDYWIKRHFASRQV